MAEPSLNKYKTEHLFSYSVTVDANMFFMKGLACGTRVTGCITGGKIWGPRLNGKLLPVGADWSIVHPNGVVSIDCRAQVESDDGAQIYMSYTGRIDLGSPEAAIDYGNGKLPPIMGNQTLPVLESDDPRYDWVNRVSCFGIGRVDFTEDPIVIQYDVYAFYSTPFDKD